MLSEKIKKYFHEKRFLPNPEIEKYKQVLIELNVPLESAFAEFNLTTIGPTFIGRKGIREIQNVCWFKIYSNYDYSLEILKKFNIPKHYLPISSFESDSVILYDIDKDAVIDFSFDKLKLLLENKIEPNWKTFNDFLEWYFEL